MTTLVGKEFLSISCYWLDQMPGILTDLFTVCHLLIFSSKLMISKNYFRNTISVFVILSGLIWVQTVSKEYQQTTLADKGPFSIMHLLSSIWARCFVIWIFIYVYTLCMQSGRALMRLCRCPVSSVFSVFAISTEVS